MNETGKEMNESRGHSGFDYESFRQETITKMLADRQATDDAGRGAGQPHPVAVQQRDVL